MADSDGESDLSGDENLDNVGDFDLIDVQQEDRERLERAWYNVMGESDEEDEFPGFDPTEAYETPRSLTGPRLKTPETYMISRNVSEQQGCLMVQVVP